MIYPIPFKRNNIYYFVYSDPIEKKRKQKSTGCYRKIDAQNFIYKFLTEIEEKTSRETLAEYAAPFFLWDECPRVQRILQEGKTIGRTHVNASRRRLERFILKDKISTLRIKDIRRGHVLDFRNRLLKLNIEKIIDGEKIMIPLGKNSVNKTIQTLKAILTEAYLREDIDRNPGYKVGNIVHEKQIREFLLPKEIKLLFDDSPGPWPDIRTHGVFSTLAYTGMRVGEVLALTWNRIDFEAGTILIDKAWKNGTDIGLPKWNKIREISMCRALENTLLKIKDESVRIAPEDLVFCWEDGIRLGDTWVRKNFKRVMLATINPFGNRTITPHCLRHSMNTNLLAAGANPLMVQAYLGWSSGANQQTVLTPVQQGYTHLSGNMLAPVAGLIDEIY